MINLLFLLLFGSVIMTPALVWFCWIRRNPADRFWHQLAIPTASSLIFYLLWLLLVAFPARIEVMAYLEALGYKPGVTPGTFNLAFVIHFISTHGTAFIVGLLGILLSQRFLLKWRNAF